MNEHGYHTTNEELLAIYKKAKTAVIGEMLELKSSHKRVMVLEKMWLNENRGRGCERCGTANDLTVDHIIPEAILDLMGLFPKENFIPENYQVLCKRCNHFKSNRLDFANPKTKPLLKKFVDCVK